MQEFDLAEKESDALLQTGLYGSRHELIAMGMNFSFRVSVSGQTVEDVAVI